MPALDYSRVAELYDRYCVFDGDLPYWQSLVEGVEGEVLELMAGTGRVSLPLVETGTRLVCLDSSPSMLAVLRAKLERRGLQASVIAGDVTRLPLRAHYPLVLLPFQGFSELATPTERQATMRSAAERLGSSGRFVLTSHDPESRRRTLDGEWHQLGGFADAAGETLRLALRGEWQPADAVVVGEQRLTMLRSDGTVREEISVPLRFALPSVDEIRELAERSGLELVEVHGDYRESPYRPGESPCIVAVLEPRR